MLHCVPSILLYHKRKFSAMTLYIGVVSQKGGVGKSTISRLLAREYAVHDWKVKIADFDVGQGTNFNWHSRRLARDVEPEIPVEQFKSVRRAATVGESYDLMILDGAAQTSKLTSEIAKVSDFIIITTGTNLDDLQPSVIIAHDLVNDGMNIDHIAFALCRTGKRSVGISNARHYLGKTPYFVVPGEMPESEGYKIASDLGRTPTETSYPTLNEKADKLAQKIINRLEKVTDQKEVA